MKPSTVSVLILVAFLAACGQQAVVPTAQLGSTATIYAEIATAEPTATPQTYSWRGIFLTVPELPSGPATAAVLSVEPQPALTLDAAQALAAQFGVQGDAYDFSGSILVREGAQHFLVTPAGYFEYYPVYDDYMQNAPLPSEDDAKSAIDAFLTAHGFDFDYQLDLAQGFNAWAVLPILDGGLPLRYEHFWANGLIFNFVDGAISYVSGSLAAAQPVGEFEIISAADALQRVLDGNYAGLVEGMHSLNGAPGPWLAWQRSYPLNTQVTRYGWLNSWPSLSEGDPLVMLDTTRVIGNSADVPAGQQRVYVTAVGSHQQVGDEVVFNLESWQRYAGQEEGFLGTLQNGIEGVLLEMEDGASLRIPDAPTGLQYPLENVYAIGAVQGDTLEWTSMDLRAGNGMGGGGGGGGALYPLNLSGTAMPFATQTPQPTIEPQGTDFSAVVEQVELVYFALNPLANDANVEPGYAQPMWRFSGHYSDGSEFEIFVQALQAQYLSPDVQMLEGPG
jgi:hypothetical protein